MTLTLSNAANALNGLDDVLREAGVVRIEWVIAASDGRTCVVVTCDDGRTASSGSLLLSLSQVYMPGTTQ